MSSLYSTGEASGPLNGWGMVQSHLSVGKRRQQHEGSGKCCMKGEMFSTPLDKNDNIYNGRHCHPLATLPTLFYNTFGSSVDRAVDYSSTTDKYP